MSLNLTNCKFLAKIPDLSGMENLKYLTLSGCKSLIEVDSSIGFLDKLATLDLSRCSNRVNFPPMIRLKSLEMLILSGCKKLENFPEIVDKMDSLRELEIQESGIREYLHQLHISVDSKVYGHMVVNPLQIYHPVFMIFKI